MITTKYNFKMWLHKKYPDIISTPVYGIPAYILSKPMSDEDNFLYNVQQLPSGQYVVFVGMSIPDAREALLKLNEGKEPIERKHQIAAPTTFSSFEQWLLRNNIKPLNRTFCNHVSASQLLMSDNIQNCLDRDAIKTWYLYELPIQNGVSLNDWEQEAYSKVPYSIVQNKDGVSVVCVLIKASNSSYKSKRTLFTEKFTLMQPIYEQLIVAAARASTRDEVQEGSGDWIVVKQLCEQYMGILFETTGAVDIVKMKEAANAGTLGLWTRDRSNFQVVEGSDF